MIKCVVCYDVHTQKTNKSINKLLSKLGYRVQNSVYEICINYNELGMVSQRIESIINKSTDRCVIYNLGKVDKVNTVHIGKTVNAVELLTSEGYLII